MTMQLRLVTWNLPHDWLPDDGDTAGTVVDLLSILDRDEVLEMLETGNWVPVSHTVDSFASMETGYRQGVLSVLFQKAP